MVVVKSLFSDEGEGLFSDEGGCLAMRVGVGME